VYQGSADDAALNAGILRYEAETVARAAIGRFETTGQIDAPPVTLHTTGDPIVPAAHQEFYATKVSAAGRESLLEQEAVVRYGHCAFSQAEVVSAFNRLVGRATP
jgi:hypothetical protein